EKDPYRCSRRRECHGAAISYRARDPQVYFYPGKAWSTPFVRNSYQFLGDGARLLDARTMFFYNATGVTPAMAIQMVGKGSQYAIAFVDAEKNGSGANCFKCTFLSGEKTLQILSGQDSGPNVRSGASFSG